MSNSKSEINTKFKVLVVNYGELFLKKNNRKLFINQLIKNIKQSLITKKNQLKINTFYDKLILEIKNEENDIIIKHLSKIFGISNFFLAYKIKSDKAELLDFIYDLGSFFDLKDSCSFKLHINRVDKSFTDTSANLKIELGNIIKDKYKISVDLLKSELNFYIKIYKEYILIYEKKDINKGLLGLPVCSAGKVVSLLSGGIDSPVSIYKLLSRGCSVIACHFYYGENSDYSKIIEIIDKLKVYSNDFIQLIAIDIKPIVIEINHISNEKYRLIILKRVFMKISNIISKKLGINAISTGDSLSQVSSQTIESLTSIYDNSELLVLTPLICLDKHDIIKVAKEIDTYDISIKKYNDCCSLFQPKHPIIKPKLSIIKELESEIFLDSIIESILSTINLI